MLNLILRRILDHKEHIYSYHSILKIVEDLEQAVEVCEGLQYGVILTTESLGDTGNCICNVGELGQSQMYCHIEQTYFDFYNIPVLFLI